MNRLILKFSLLFLLLVVFAESDESSTEEPRSIFERHGESLPSLNPLLNSDAPVIKGSELIRNFLEHFKNPEAATRPLPIPDPLIMPDRVYPVFSVKVSTTHVTAFGVSHIRVRNFTADAVKMQAHFVLRMPRLVLTGNYSYYDWLSKHYYGDFNITLINALNDCNAKLEVTFEGELAASKITMDLSSHEQMYMTFENAGFVGFLVNTFGPTLFSAVKPYFLSIISENIRSNINEHLKLLKIMFPNSIQPLDLAIAEGRKFVKNNDLDPYYIPNYQHATSMYSVDLTDTVLTGLSSFHRIGDVKLLMDNHIVNAVLNVGTEEVSGSCTWEAGIGGVFTKTGSSSFTIDYVDVMISVNQSLDIRRKPRIIDLNIKIGNIQLRMEGAGVLDYLAEAGVNVLPNLLRYQILLAGEKPIRRKLQEAMDSVDIEAMIIDKLPMIDQQLYKNNDVTVLEDNFVEEGTLVQRKEEEERGYDFFG